MYKPSNKFVEDTVKYWGSMSSNGVGSLVLISARFTGPSYLNILKKHLRRSAHRLIGEDFILQHDNDPRHRSGVVITWLGQQRIEVLDDYPPNSPDISLIENLFALWKRNIAKFRPDDVLKLKKIATREWKKLTPQLCSRLVSSVPRRLQALLDSNGTITKY